MFALLLFILNFISGHHYDGEDDKYQKRWEVFGDTFKEAGMKMFKIRENLNKLNIIIIGKTGSGKSKLINNVFRGKLAKTGVGKRITETITPLTKPDYPLTVYDTPGFELKYDQQNTLLHDISELIKNNSKDGDPSKYIHCIWYCINCNSKRVEDEEINLIKKLSSDYLNKIPIIIVLTQCYDQNDKEKMLNLIYSLKLNIPVVPVVAKRKNINIQGLKEPIVIPSFGLDNLVDEMASFLPDILAETLNNVQIVSIGQKRKSAIRAIALGTTAATAMGAIPFAGKLFFFGSTQFLMIKKIADSYGITVLGETVSELINNTIADSMLFSASGSSDQAYTIPSSVLSFIDMYNHGGFISAVSSGIITTALGYAYMEIAEARYKNEYKSIEFFDEILQENVQKLYNEKLNDYDL